MKLGSLVRGQFKGVPVYHMFPDEWHGPPTFESIGTSHIGVLVEYENEFYKVLLSNGFVGWVHRGDVEEVR